jgi:photosystem II stability/assembly factor-like uncharacterized protein
MKKLNLKLTSLVILISSALYAQSWVNMMHNPKSNVHDVQNAFEQWYAQHKSDNDDITTSNSEEKEEGTELFRRWEHFMVPRTYPSGVRPNQTVLAKEYQDYLQSSSNAVNRTMNTANWTYAGNTGVPTYGGDGRVNRVRFYPGNTNILFACTPGGGLWKSTNGGTTWSTNTDQLMGLSMADIAINPLNPNIMYLGTGDNDGVETDFNFASRGVLRSTDGGTTWHSTGLSFALPTSGPDWGTINQIVFNPEDTGLIYATVSTAISTSLMGVYYSRNSGTTWTQSLTNDSIKDIEFEPSHGSTVYASSFGGHFYRSTDSGKTFTHITAGLPTTNVGRIAIGVTAADSNVVYVLAVNLNTSAYYGLYRSTDRGQTFTTMSTTPNLLGWSSTGSDSYGQAWYNLAILVSPTNKDSVFVGGSFLWQSADGGATWTYNSNFATQVHVDIHSMVFYPGSSRHFLVTNDGGISVTTDAGNTWTDISNNLEIAQQYSIGLAADSSGLWLTGWQDDGTNIARPHSPDWQASFVGDGMVCFIDYTNDNNMFASSEYGYLGYSTDGGASWNTTGANIPEYARWVTPWLQDPQQPNILYSGFQNVWKSPDKGQTWNKISTWGTGYIDAIAVCPSNDQYIYVSEITGVYRSTNGGSTWTSISSGLPLGSAFLYNLATDYFNPSHVFAVFSGWNASDKVYESFNAGSTWTNISSGLPNLPVNCIVNQPGSHDGIYIGTDIGVYYKDSTTGGWVAFNTGLPNVQVFDLKLYKDNTLIAATFGRGTWQTPTYSNVNTGINNIPITENSVKLYPNPTTGNVQVAFDGPEGQYQIRVVNVLGQTVYSNNVTSTGHYTGNINLSGNQQGIYIVTITGANTKVEKKVVLY